MNLRREPSTSRAGVEFFLQVLAGLLEIPEIGLPVLVLALAVGIVATPFYIGYHAYRAFGPALPTRDRAEVPELPAGPLAAPCPYCGTRDHEPVLRCHTCGVPHHAECWRENGGCTVYACAGRPRPAPGPAATGRWTPRGRRVIASASA